MAGERKFTRIPPESTGDRVYMIHTAELRYDAKDTSHTWQIGEMYSFQGSSDSNNDFMFHVHGVVEETTTTGVLSIHYNKKPRHLGYSGENDANIQYEGATVAVVNTAPVDLYIPAQNIMGYDNPEYGMNVDPQGSAQVTFAEGEPQLDAWGKLRTSGATKLGDYVFSTASVLNENFSKVATRGGGGNSYSSTAAVTFDDTGKFVDVMVKNPNDLATATSRTYHHYIAGASHLFMGTALFPGAYEVGETPTATGVSRRFGTFDANNGFMFHVGPDGVLYLERRSSNTGSKVDTLIACSDETTANTLGIDTFNKDLVDGSRGSLNASGMKLNLAKNNQYWIDLQWHGAGRARFGTYHNGRRVVMHEYYHNNRNDLPMNQTASLPVCTANYAYTTAELDAHSSFSSLNLTGAATDVEIKTRVFSQAMWSEVDIDLQSLGKPAAYSTTHLPVVGSGFQHLFSLRLNPLSGTKTSHDLVIPTRIVNINYNESASSVGTISDALVHWRISENTVHHGHVWSDIEGTTLQSSTAGINYETTGVRNRILEDMYNGRGEKVLTDTFIDLQNGAWKNSSDDGGTFNQNIASFTNSTTGSTTENGSFVSSSTVLGVTSASGINIGASITGTGIPSGTTVEAIDGTNLTISKSSTVSDGATINWTNPLSVSIDTTQESCWVLSEPYTKTFGPNPGGGLYRLVNADGLTVSTNDVYLYFTGKDTGVLYADATWATPVTSSGTYSGSEAYLHGFIGLEFVIDFFAHEQIESQESKAMFVVEWKEIIQN